MTPAMAAGLTDKLMDMEDVARLIDDAEIPRRYSDCELVQLGFSGSMEEIDDCLGKCSSYERTDRLGWIMLGAWPSPSAPLDRSRRCLQIFLEWGNMCDAPWPWRSVFAGALRVACSRIDLAEVLQPEARGWLLAAPPLVSVFRGCDRGRERGLSWTLDRSIAEGFAHGKRCSNKEPTLVAACIPKAHIFGVFLTRDEAEIALDPRRLRKVRIEPIAHELAR